MIAAAWLLATAAHAAFSVVFLPDVQTAVSNDLGRMYAQGAQWICRCHSDLQIAAVIGLGDVSDSNSPAEWDRFNRASACYTNTGIRQAFARGNHDSPSEVGGDNMFDDARYITSYTQRDTKWFVDSALGSTSLRTSTWAHRTVPLDLGLMDWDYRSAEADAQYAWLGNALSPRSRLLLLVRHVAISAAQTFQGDVARVLAAWAARNMTPAAVVSGHGIVSSASLIDGTLGVLSNTQNWKSGGMTILYMTAYQAPQNTSAWWWLCFYTYSPFTRGFLTSPAAWFALRTDTHELLGGCPFEADHFASRPAPPWFTETDPKTGFAVLKSPSADGDRWIYPCSANVPVPWPISAIVVAALIPVLMLCVLVGSHLA